MTTMDKYSSVFIRYHKHNFRNIRLMYHIFLKSRTTLFCFQLR